MRASVGDRVVIASHRVDGPVRDGEIMAVGDDGAPPYRVRWSDNGRVSVYFPGPDAHVQHFREADDHEVTSGAAGGTEPTTESSSQRKTWRIDVVTYEGQYATSAQAVLHGEIADGVQGIGVARRRPGEPDVPTVGDELALARALRRLSDVLLAAATNDLSDATGSPVSLRP